MSSEMVERVQKAICDAMELTDSLNMTAAEKYALAAINALREPTEDMVDSLSTAYGDCVHDFDTTWKAGIGHCLGVRDPIDFAVYGKKK